MTGLKSRALGPDEYRGQLSTAGLTLVSEYKDEGQNSYFDALKAR